MSKPTPQPDSKTTETKAENTTLERLEEALAKLKGPHDDEAAAREIERAIQRRDQQDRDQYRYIFEAGYRAGYLARASEASDRACEGLL